jgi:hypothetical protein
MSFTATAIRSATGAMTVIARPGAAATASHRMFTGMSTSIL